MRREATQAGDGWGHPAPSGQRAPGPRQRAEQLLDTCLGAVADIRCGEVRLLDAVVALRSEIDHQLFGAGESTGSDTRARHRRADSDAATVDELATASGMSRLYTHGLVRLAGAAPARVARGRGALAAGRVELRRVIDWYEATDHLTEEDALAIGDSVFTPRRDGTPRSASDFRRLLSKRVKQAEAADREARRQRTEEALAQRSSWASPADDGTGSLTVTGEATRVAAAHSRLDAAARRAKAAGDERSLSQLRSDLHLDLLLVGQLPSGRAPGKVVVPGQVVVPEGADAAGESAEPAAPATPQAPPVCTSCGAVSSDYFPYPTVGDPVLPPAHCTVVVGLDVLVEDARGPSDPPSGGPPGSSGSPPEQTGSPPAEMGNPPVSTGSPPGEPGSPPTGRGSALGWMPGFGYLDPDHVRKIAIREGSVWQRLVADPLSGHAVSVSPFTYRPTASVARFVRARDGVARDPGSGSFGATEAERCELDHIVPFDAGGTTTADNLQALSRRGHARKTKRQWEVTGDAGGSLRWTSLAGKRYTSDPLDYRDF